MTRPTWIIRRMRTCVRAGMLAFATILGLALPLAVLAQQLRLDARGATGFEPTSASSAPATRHGVRLGDPSAPLGHYALLLDEVRGHPLSLDDARAHLAAGDFRRSTAVVPNHGNLAPPLWMHLVVVNAEPVPLDERIYVAEGWTDHVDAWLVSPGGATTHWQAGDALSPSRFLRVGLGFGFDARLRPGRSELFVRADSIDSAALALRLVPLSATASLEGPAQHWLGLVHGFLLALVVAYGLLWLALRETSLLRYVAYVGSYLFMHLAYSGIAARSAWPDSPAVARFATVVGMTLFASAGLWFARDFLALARWAPRTNRTVAWLVRIALTAMAACVLFDAPAAAVQIAFAYIMLFTILMVFLGMMAVIARRTQARSFLAASLASMVGAFVTTLAVMGRLPFTAVTFRAVEVGVMVEASIWALALGLRLRRDRENHVHALQLAQHDSLTGLCNRRGFLERALPLHATSTLGGAPSALILLDLDHFKEINDLHGHDAGDRTLVAVADRLRAMSRLEDVVARWGGEEFLVLLSDTPLETAAAFAEQLRASLAGMAVKLADGSVVTLTASLGVVGSTAATSFDGLLRQADAALYAAKQAGRNRVWSGRQPVAA